MIFMECTTIAFQEYGPEHGLSHVLPFPMLKLILLFEERFTLAKNLFQKPAQHGQKLQLKILGPAIGFGPRM